MNDTSQAPSSETAPPAAAAPAPEPDGFAVIEKLNAENAELKDRVLRALADVENMRRRSEREAADARTYAVTAFARDLLTVADNFARALESLPAETRVAADGAIKAFIEGVELTGRELQAALGRHGVKKLEPRGEKFDPNFHQAMFEAPDEAVPPGTVTEVVQSGWKIGDRVGVAAGLIDDQHACRRAGIDIDGIEARAIAGDDQEVRRPPQQVRIDVKVPRQFVARRADLIGMRGGEDGRRSIRRVVVLHFVEPHVIALAEYLDKTDRLVRRDPKHALAVDDIVHRFPFPLLSWPGSSRPSRLDSHCAERNGIPGTRPGMTIENITPAAR